MQIEVSPKRVRGMKNGTLILDSKRARLVWEVPHFPQFYIPVADVRMERLKPTQTRKPSKTRGEGHCFDVEGAAAGAWHYPDHAELKDHVRFDWDALDAWFEERSEERRVGKEC